MRIKMNDKKIDELKHVVRPLISGLSVGHGSNAVDGASGPGWLHQAAKPGEWCGASVEAPRPELQEAGWVRRMGDGYSEGHIVWLIQASELRAFLTLHGMADAISVDLAALPDTEQLIWDDYCW